MLDRIKALLGFKDEEHDELLQTVIENTSDRLKLLTGGTDYIPSELMCIVVEVSISRFNRIGSEGLSSHNVEGESLAWSEDDFAPYMNDIQAWLDAQDDPETSRGRLRFL